MSFLILSNLSGYLTDRALYIFCKYPSDRLGTHVTLMSCSDGLVECEDCAVSIVMHACMIIRLPTTEDSPLSVKVKVA